MAIYLKPLDEKYKNADEATKNQLKELALNEALSKAVSEQELNSLEKVLVEKLRRLELAEDALNKRVKELEKPKSALEVKIEPKKEVPSTSWKEKLIKLLQK